MSGDKENVVLGFDVMSAFARTQDPADYIYSFGKALEYLHVCDFERGVPGTKRQILKQWKTALDKADIPDLQTINRSGQKCLRRFHRDSHWNL